MVDEPLADARDMFAVHTMFRREFGLMPGLVRAVTAGDKQRTLFVADHVALVSKVLDLHHSGEDKHVWPRLRERGTAEIASIVGVMEEQHGVIHHGLLQVAAAVESWRDSASVQTRDDLAGAVSQFLPAMQEHLALEEERVVPLIEKYITAAEYALLSQEGNAEVPRETLPTIFGMIMYEADPAVIDTIVAEMPAEIQPVIKDAAAQAYAGYAQQLYGTATPARVTGSPQR
jgi:iron-sulfur cluster repair protein YtfE (RIC family)